MRIQKNYKLFAFPQFNQLIQLISRIPNSVGILTGSVAFNLKIATAAVSIFWFRLKRLPVDELAEPGHHTEEAHDAVDVQNVVVGSSGGFNIVNIQWLEQ